MPLPIQNVSPICALLVIVSGIVQGDASAFRNAPVHSQPGQQRVNQNPSAPQSAPPQRPERVEIEQLPGPVYSHLTRGNGLAAAGRYDDAITEYKLALEIALRPVFTVCLALGSAYFDKKDFKSAVEAYKQAITARPNNFRGYFNLGQSLYELSDYPGAEQAYRRALALNPGILESQIHEFLGLSLYNQKRLDEAIAEYRVAIDKAAGKYAEANYDLGIALMERGALAGSESAFRKAIEQEPGFPEAHYNLGLVLEKQGHSAEAVEHYRMYLQGRPDASNAASLRQHIDLLKKK